MRHRVGIICVLALIASIGGVRKEEYPTPGVIRRDLGKVSFVQDTITVRMDLRPVQDFQNTLKKARIELGRLLTEKDAKVMNKATVAVLKSQMERLDLMILPTSARSKRSLFSFGGDILHSLFGTATDKQVEKVYEKTRAIEKWAASKGKLITKVVERVNKHAEDIKNLNDDLHELSSLLDNNSKDIHNLNVTYLAQSIGSYLSFLIESFDILINAIVLASKNIVSPIIFPKVQLQNVLKHAIDSYKFEPLFDNLDNYYSAMHAKFVDDYVFIFVPFASAASFNLFHFIPFPSFIDDSLVVELDIDETFVLLNSDFSSIALTSVSSYKDFCIAVASQNYLCPANKFHFFPASHFDCMLNLAVHSHTSNSCKFRHIQNKTLAIYHAHPFNYIFSRNLIKVSVTCQGKSQLKEFQGNFLVNEDCGVSAPNMLKIYPSHSRAADATLAFVPSSDIFLRHLTIPESAKNVVLHTLKAEENLVDNTPTLSEIMNDFHPMFSYVGLPIFIIMAVGGTVLLGFLFYKKRLHQLLGHVRDLANRTTAVEEGPEEGNPNL